MVGAQGGDLDKLPAIGDGINVTAGKAGYVGAIETEHLGLAIIELGGGRKLMGDAIDHAVGLEMLVRVGDRVKRGQVIARIFASAEKARAIEPMIAGAIEIQDAPRDPLPLIVERIE